MLSCVANAFDASVPLRNSALPSVSVIMIVLAAPLVSPFISISSPSPVSVSIGKAYALLFSQRYENASS